LSDPWNALAAGKGVIISEALILRETCTRFQKIALETPLASGVSVLAIFYDYSSDQGTIILDNDLYESLWHDPSIASMGLFVDPDISVEETVATSSHFQGRQDLLVQSNRSLRQGSLILIAPLRSRMPYAYSRLSSRSLVFSALS